MKILLSGLVGCRERGLFERNRGNLTILYPMVKQLREHFPNATIDTTIQLKNPIEGIREVETPIKPRNWIFAFMRFLFKRPYFKNYDIILSWNGDLFSNTRHRSFLLWYVFEILAAKRSGSKVIEWVSSPGPFNTLFYHFIGKLYYNRLNLIINRDGSSTQHLKNLGISTITWTTACPSFLKERYIESNLNNTIGIVPSINCKINDLIQIISYLLEYTDHKIVLLVNSHLKEDIETYEILANLFKNNISKCTHELDNIIPKLNMLITCRLHAGVLAITQNVPTIFIPYGHKFNMVNSVGYVIWDSNIDKAYKKCHAPDVYKLDAVRKSALSSFLILRNFCEYNGIK